MRKRIQHPRKQQPSRVQLERVRTPAQGVNETGRWFSANVDMKPLIWNTPSMRGVVAVFARREVAEREALFALACRYLEPATWAELVKLYRYRKRPSDLALIDLGELGLVDDNFKINRAGRLVARRYLKPPRAITTANEVIL